MQGWPMMVTTVVISANSEMMITFELLVYPSLALIFMMLIYGAFGPRVQLERNITHHLNINVDKCASEDCVRCTKYKVIIQKVVKRYKSDSAVKQEVVNCSNRMHRAVTSLDPDRKYGAADEQQPNVLYMEELSARPFWSEAEFVSDIAVLESHVQEIREEFENVYNTVWPDGWLVNNTSSGEWAVYHLFNQGAPIPSNCQKCPKTCAVLKNLVSSMSNSGNLFGNVSFSVVQSSTHISPHYGPTNVRIRCHLGLRISDPRTSYMVVNGEKCGWESGKCLLFDDSFLHEVHHRDVDGAARAILLIDLWHPETTHEERQLIDNLFKFEKASFPSIPTISMQIPASNDL